MTVGEPHLTPETAAYKALLTLRSHGDLLKPFPEMLNKCIPNELQKQSVTPISAQLPPDALAEGAAVAESWDGTTLSSLAWEAAELPGTSPRKENTSDTVAESCCATAPRSPVLQHPTAQLWAFPANQTPSVALFLTCTSLSCTDFSRLVQSNL